MLGKRDILIILRIIFWVVELAQCYKHTSPPIERIGSKILLKDISVGVGRGFCHRTESDLVLFVSIIIKNVLVLVYLYKTIYVQVINLPRSTAFRRGSRNFREGGGGSNLSKKIDKQKKNKTKQNKTNKQKATKEERDGASVFILL